MTSQKLNLDVWLDALTELAGRAKDANRMAQNEITRTFHRLTALAPAEVALQFDHGSECELEAICAAGVPAAAVMKLLSPCVGFMISNPPGQPDRTVASVWVPNQETECTSPALPCALALVVAASTALILAFGERYEIDDPVIH